MPRSSDGGKGKSQILFLLDWGLYPTYKILLRHTQKSSTPFQHIMQQAHCFNTATCITNKCYMVRSQGSSVHTMLMLQWREIGLMMIKYKGKTFHIFKITKSFFKCLKLWNARSRFNRILCSPSKHSYFKFLCSTQVTFWTPGYDAVGVDQWNLNVKDKCFWKELFIRFSLWHKSCTHENAKKAA